eukprot:m.790988 g.790988  ORF g.790988 m.790988 type:complete len:254 (-) comp59209_c1_seq3:17-778(-)
MSAGPFPTSLDSHLPTSSFLCIPSTSCLPSTDITLMSTCACRLETMSSASLDQELALPGYDPPPRFSTGPPAFSSLTAHSSSDLPHEVIEMDDIGEIHAPPAGGAGHRKKKARVVSTSSHVSGVSTATTPGGTLRHSESAMRPSDTESHLSGHFKKGARETTKWQEIVRMLPSQKPSTYNLLDSIHTNDIELNPEMLDEIADPIDAECPHSLVARHACRCDVPICERDDLLIPALNLRRSRPHWRSMMRRRQW